MKSSPTIRLLATISMIGIILTALLPALAGMN